MWWNDLACIVIMIPTSRGGNEAHHTVLLPLLMHAWCVLQFSSRVGPRHVIIPEPARQM